MLIQLIKMTAYQLRDIIALKGTSLLAITAKEHMTVVLPDSRLYLSRV